jgi:hypothetical protein
MWSPSISKETPPHSSYDWHDDPEPQYVITLSGMLEFATRDGPAAAWLRSIMGTPMTLHFPNASRNCNPPQR